MFWDIFCLKMEDPLLEKSHHNVILLKHMDGGTHGSQLCHHRVWFEFWWNQWCLTSQSKDFQQYRFYVRKQIPPYTLMNWNYGDLFCKDGSVDWCCTLSNIVLLVQLDIVKAHCPGENCPQLRENGWVAMWLVWMDSLWYHSHLMVRKGRIGDGEDLCIALAVSISFFSHQGSIMPNVLFKILFGFVWPCSPIDHPNHLHPTRAYQAITLEAAMRKGQE